MKYPDLSQDPPPPNFVGREKNPIFIALNRSCKLLSGVSRKYQSTQSFYYNIYFSIEGTYNTERKNNIYMIGTKSEVRIKMTKKQAIRQKEHPPLLTIQHTEMKLSMSIFF